MRKQSEIETLSMNIIEKTDDELKEIALTMWEAQLKYSREGDYEGFTQNISAEVLATVHTEVAAKQFSEDKLARSLSPDYDFLGLLRRDDQVTCLFRVRSTEKEGEWLGRMVLGNDKGEIKIFASSIF
jgi:hypothetical protein